MTTKPKTERVVVYLPPETMDLLRKRAASVSALAGTELPLPMVARGQIERGLTAPDLPPVKDLLRSAYLALDREDMDFARGKINEAMRALGVGDMEEG